MSECIRVEKKAIRCVVCDKLLAENKDKIALEDFHHVGVICCDEHYKKYFREYTSTKRGHGVIYILRGHFKKGEDLTGNDIWLVLERCKDVRLY